MVVLPGVYWLIFCLAIKAAGGFLPALGPHGPFLWELPMLNPLGLVQITMLVVASFFLNILESVNTFSKRT